MALVGQLVAVLFVANVLNYDFPLISALILIGLSALFNIALVLRFGVGHRPANDLAAAQLAFDSLQLGGLLWMTGGLENPFALLLLAPVSVSATTLPRRETFFIGALAILIASALAVFHLPVPWNSTTPLMLPDFYVVGIWTALLSGVVFIAAYTNRVAHEARQLADALSATELALSRQQQLSALDGLAAAAAHELGTPLSTIALAAKEMLCDVEKGPVRDDICLIIEQTARCRTILSRLRKLDDDDASSPFSAVLLSELIAELTRPFTHYGKTISISTSGTSDTEPVVVRNVGLLYGLGNLIENAVQFARTKVDIEAKWDAHQVFVVITDDGPGIAPDLLSRLGEPYLTTHAHHGIAKKPFKRRDDHGGLGLGVFIAQTLLMRSGASIEFSNSHMEGHARVQIQWRRSDIVLNETKESGAL
ncbi:Sensor histidine kinase PrrB (RegB) [hydrothermal vent metagenome]|uniref:histidine kinase n=1 Tax=hydrothermal vent metagenome TaxID=652676 RepID=A0A3B0UUT5_9ZZZZ